MSVGPKYVAKGAWWIICLADCFLKFSLEVCKATKYLEGNYLVPWDLAVAMC